MTVQQIANMAPKAAADGVQAFYEAHPYPPPVEELDSYRQRWQDRDRRRAGHLTRMVLTKPANRRRRPGERRGN